MIFQLVSSDCAILRKMVKEHYPNLDKLGRDMMAGLVCSIINEQYAPQVGTSNHTDLSRYRDMLVDAQMIISEYNKIS